MILNLQVLVGHHGAALVPLAPSDDVHLAYAERIGATNNCSHVEIAHGVFYSNLQAYATSIKLGHDLIVTLAFEFIEHIARIGHYFLIVRHIGRVYDERKQKQKRDGIPKTT